MISEALRLIRVYHNLTQARLADDLAMSKSHLSEIESGKKKPSLDILETYSSHFNVPLSSLFFFAEGLDQTKSKDLIRGKIAIATLKLLGAIAGTEELQTSGKDISH